MPDPGTQATAPREPLVDFDHWTILAKTNPEAFESRRAQMIEDMIQSMPVHRQQRMRCLQWKIDQIRRQASNPMAACIKLSEMMWDSLVGPAGLRDLMERLGDGDFKPPRSAKVLDLHAPN